MDGAALVAGGGVFCLLVVVLVVLATVAARRRERRRAGGLSSWAQANGWTVTDHPAVDWGAQLPGGNPRGVGVALFGVARGRRVGVGEYSVTDVQSTGDGGTTPNTHFYTVAVAQLTRPFPDIRVEPRGGASRLARAVAGPGETATGNAAFDKAFRIRTGNPQSIPAWCSPALMDAQLGGHVPAWSVHGTEVLIFQPGRLDPAAVGPHAERVAYLAALLNPPG